ncbi:MAG: DUF4325 domain-containing protein [Bacteroidales bacterium]|nr:DUF4325 domain-containing protein [Bacteroidales bacterium]
MCTINISYILKDSDYPTAGAKLYDMIIARYDAEDSITLDLMDVDALPSMFLNTSIGKLITDKGILALKKIRFTNITKSQAARIKDYVAKVS